MDRIKNSIARVFFGTVVIFYVTCLHASNDLSGVSEKNVFDMDLLQNELQRSSITEDDSGGGQVKENENLLSILIRIIIYLFIVVILIFGITWIFKRMGLPGTVKNNGPGSMDLLEVLPLSQNRTIAMVRILDAVYILGQNQGTMMLIDKIEGQKAVELISTSKGGTSIVQFKDAINNFMGKFKKNT